MNKGFTLVELLIVMSIIGLIAVIAVPSSITISKKIKQKMLDSKIELIAKGAIVWGQQNKSKLTETDADSNKCKTLTIKDLLDENALEPDEVESGEKKLLNPTNSGSLNDCQVKIFIKNKRVYATYLKTVSDSENLDVCYYKES